MNFDLSSKTISTEEKITIQRVNDLHIKYIEKYNDNVIIYRDNTINEEFINKYNIERFFYFIKYGLNCEEFVVSFEYICNMVDRSLKKTIKEFLIKNFKKDIDYKYVSDYIFITIDCFKSFSILSNNKNIKELKLKYNIIEEALKNKYDEMFIPKIKETKFVVNHKKKDNRSPYEIENNCKKTKKKKVYKYNGISKIEYDNGKIMYETNIKIDNTNFYYLGTYETIELAAYAYNCKMYDLFGKNCNKYNDVNKPDNYIWNNKLNILQKI